MNAPDNNAFTGGPHDAASFNGPDRLNAAFATPYKTRFPINSSKSPPTALYGPAFDESPNDNRNCSFAPPNQRFTTDEISGVNNPNPATAPE